MELRGARLERRGGRGRWRAAMLRLPVWAAAAAAIGYWAYEMGGERAALDSAASAKRAERLEAENAQLRAAAAAAEDARARAAEALAESRRAYRADVPTGPERDVLAAVRRRAAEGVPVERLAEVLDAAQADPRCAPEVATRRFMVWTPLSRGAHGSVSFANNAITVTGGGQPALAPDGAPEAWFDPAAPVRIAFALPGGAESVSEGLLPLHHTVTMGGEAHRFTVTPAETRGFVLVTGQVCDYP